jgi:hypothetical protein
VPYPYMHVDFRIHHAASGGPVVGADGSVIGVNCRYMDPAGPGVVAQMRCLQGAYIDYIILKGETVPQRVTFSELLNAGVVSVRGYSPDTAIQQPGRTVRLEVPIGA